MINISDFFARGLKNTVRVKNNAGFSYTGSFKEIQGTTLVERWHLGEFNSADYTISIDLNTEHKEIVKCLITGTVNEAKLVVYARNNTKIELVELSAIVTESFVELFISPKTPNANGAKFLYTANYFASQTPLSV